MNIYFRSVSHPGIIGGMGEWGATRGDVNVARNALRLALAHPVSHSLISTNDCLPHSLQVCNWYSLFAVMLWYYFVSVLPLL